ncbi:hypothetical protein [Sphingomonas cavernae]|uniref:Uncharacterized protein n=1 Tax=Sphingomonas cavernae TaxID=2320861 RepID=A0A418WMH2_9SPHN|nr:hypothetical protein [Sphingomonas cavernae]RJF91204.1 hypothetical protein D3876_13885 [Sphingomonas cavernae]
MKAFLKITLPLSLAVAAAFPQVALADDAEQSTPSLNVAEFQGKMLYGPKGERLAAVYRVQGDSAQIILNGKMVSVPAASLSAANGKLSTSLTKRDLTSR